VLRVALPNKGQLSEPAREMLREAGYPAAHAARELVVLDPDNDVEFFFLRPRDIATYTTLYFNISNAWTANAAKSDSQTTIPVLYESDFDRTNASLRVNGQFLSAGSLAGTPIQSHKGAWIGSVTNPYGQLQNFFTGAISEVLIYRGTLDSTTRSKVEIELLSRYDLSSGSSSITPMAHRSPRMSIIATSDRIEIRIDEECQVELRNIDGSLLGATSIHSGTGILPRPHGMAFLTVRHSDGSATTRSVVGLNR